MIRNLAIYSIMVFLIGQLISGITLAIIEFIPYFLSGMILTSPIYGVLRQKKGKERRITSVNFKEISKRLINSLKPNKKTITFYLILLIVINNVHVDFGIMVAKSVLLGLTTLGVTIVVWEITRFVAKKVKNIQIMSFGEAFKGAF